MLEYVRNTTMPHYTLGEAKTQIDSLLSPVSPDCSIEFCDDAAKLRNSYLVHSSLLRHQVCAVISRTDITVRSFENMSAEWLLHNICYYLHIKRSSAIDVDLDYTRDRRFIVRFMTWIMDILNIE